MTKFHGRRLRIGVLGLGFCMANLTPAGAQTLAEALADAYTTNPTLSASRAERTGVARSERGGLSQHLKVRPEGADHQWRKMPPRELSVDLVADERGGRVTDRFEAS